MRTALLFIYIRVCIYVKIYVFSSKTVSIRTSPSSLAACFSQFISFSVLLLPLATVRDKYHRLAATTIYMAQRWA